MWLRYDASLFNDTDVKKATNLLYYRQKAQDLDLLDELTAKHCLSQNQEEEMRRGGRFSSAKDIADHYGVGKSTG